MRKSTPESYGSVARALHWTSAGAVLVALGSGLGMGALGGARFAPGLLAAHVSFGLLVFVLTLARLAWWAFADRRPASHGSLARWQVWLSRAVHGLLYVAMILLPLGGIATLVLSGAVPALLSGAPIPDFSDLLPRMVHSALARVLILLLALHIGAALWHFIRGDGVAPRMGLGRP